MPRVSDIWVVASEPLLSPAAFAVVCGVHGVVTSAIRAGRGGGRI